MNSTARIQACELRNEFLLHKLARMERGKSDQAKLKQAMRYMLEDLEATRANLEESTQIRKQLEERLLQSLKMDAIGTLVGGIAHNLNNVLAGITGNLYLIRIKAQKIPDAVTHVNHVEKLAFRAAEIIQKLLTFASRARVDMDTLSFSQCIRESLELLPVSLPENIVVHQVICMDSLPLRGDSAQLHQVVLNLISNARNAVDKTEQPLIMIRLEPFHTDNGWMQAHPYFEPGHYAHLSIEDNGCGIPKDQLGNIFEPFFTTREVGKGEGLGLAMVYGAVRTHHGFILTDSSEGEGSTFHIYLPLLQQEGMVPELKQSRRATGQGTNNLILIADDRKYILETASEALEGMGYKTLQAVDGENALKLFKAHHEEVALAILDVEMPKFGGTRLAEEIRKIRPDVPVIIMTGYEKEYVLNGTKSIKNSKILTKPVQLDALHCSIQELLNHAISSRIPAPEARKR